jgi:cell division protein FtsB
MTAYAIIMTLVAAAAIVGVYQLWIKKADLEDDNAEFKARVDALETKIKKFEDAKNETLSTDIPGLVDYINRKRT